MRSTAALAAAFLVGATFVHTQLEESDPAADAALTESPSQVTLTYSTGVQRNLSRVSVHRTGQAGQPGEAGQGGSEDSPRGAAVAAGELAHPSEDDEQTLVLPLIEALESGSYRVEWRTAGPDGHPIAGDFAFRVELPDAHPADEAGADAAQPDEDEAAMADQDAAAGDDAHLSVAWSAVQSDDPPASDVLAGQAIRFLFHAGILALFGVAAFHGLILPRAAASGLDEAVVLAVRGSLWRIGLFGAALLVVSAPARLWLQAETFFPGEAAANMGAVLGGTWGAGWWIQCAAVLLIAAGLAMGRAAASPSGWKLVVLGALLLPVAALLSGHGISDEPVAIAASATWLHVGAASAWVGGLACLLFAGIPAAIRRPADDGTPPVVLLVGAFSALARIAVVTLVLSGVVKAWLHLGALSELWTTPWGFGLLVKGGWVLIVMLLGFYNWKVVQPALAADPTPKRLRRSTWWEFALGVIVVWVTAYLVVQPM